MRIMETFIDIAWFAAELALLAGVYLFVLKAVDR